MGRWLSLVVFLVGGLVFADEAADIKTLKDRLYDDYVKAGTRLAALGADGLWPDIDYRDQMSGNRPPISTGWQPWRRPTATRRTTCRGNPRSSKRSTADSGPGFGFG